MAEIVTIKAMQRKLVSTAFVAEKLASRMTEENWLQYRRSGIGGSDVGALLFPDQWGGPLSVYMSKVAGSEAQSSDAMDFGTIMEESLRNTFLPTKLARIGVTGVTVFTSPWIYRSEDKPWLIANIDGLVEFNEPATMEDGTVVQPGLYLLELKTAGGNKKDAWKDGSVPDRYYAQVQHYMGVLELTGCLVFALVDRTPEIRFVPRNGEFIDLCQEKAAALWKQIETEDPPMAGYGDLDALNLLYPQAKGEEFKDVDGLQGMAAMYLEAKAKAKTYETDATEIEARIKSLIGDYIGIQEGVLASAKWSRWTTERFDAKKLKEEHPELADQYIKTSLGSRLTVKAMGIGEEE